LQDPKSQSGYGFVYYHEPDAALRAVHTMKHANIDGVTYDCSLSYKSEEILKSRNLPFATGDPAMGISVTVQSSQHSSYSTSSSVVYPTSAPPIVAGALSSSSYDPQHNRYSPVTNPFHPPSSVSSSSFSRNPPVSNTPGSVPPRGNVFHQVSNPAISLHSQRQVFDQFSAASPSAYDLRSHQSQNYPPAYPVSAASQLSMQHLHPPPPPPPFGMMNYSPSVGLMVSAAPPTAVHMSTPPQYSHPSSGSFSSLNYSPHQHTQSPPFPMFGQMSSPPLTYHDPVQQFNSPFQQQHPLFMEHSPEMIPPRGSSARHHHRSRHRQGTLRRLEDPSFSVSRSRSSSRSISRSGSADQLSQQHHLSQRQHQGRGGIAGEFSTVTDESPDQQL
jgi:hypothetical protein